MEFHWREAKPVFWRKFDWHGKTEQELIDDFDCLGGLRRTSKQPIAIKQSYLYEYRYDSDQDTKLHEGSNCFFAHDLLIRTTIETLDLDQGLVEIKLGAKVAHDVNWQWFLFDEIRSSVGQYGDQYSPFQRTAS